MYIVAQYLSLWNLFRLGNENYLDLKCSVYRLHLFLLVFYVDNTLEVRE